MHVKLWLFFLLIVALMQHSGRADDDCETSYDVVIVGGTVCGVTAAVAATRTNPAIRVLWLVNGTRLGGMTSGGLGGVDGGKRILGGIAAELFEPFGSAVTPSFAESAVESLLATAGDAVTLVRNTGWLTSVASSGSSPRRIVSVTTIKNQSFCGAVWIDCSYEGDLMRLSGAAHVYGREGADVYAETMAGEDSSYSLFSDLSIGEKPSWFSPDVSPWVDDSNSTLLPTITSTYPSSTGGAGDNLIMSYCFRMCLTNNSSNAIPIESPADYERTALELLWRELVSVTKNRNLTLELRSLFLVRELPDSKIDLNSGQWTTQSGDGGFFPFSTDLPFAHQQYWPHGNASTRANIFAAHKWWTQALLYFLGNDPELAALQPSLVAEVKSYGRCADEYLSEPDRWTPQLYVREANRLRGATVLSQSSVCYPQSADDSVGLSEWGVDIHAVRRVAAKGDDGTWRVFNAGGRDTMRQPVTDCPGGCVEVPYRALTPRADDTANLLVPVCASFTHVAFSTFRLEPQYAIFGHAAGTAAALAAMEGLAVQSIDVAVLRATLKAQGQKLSRTKCEKKEHLFL